MQAPDPDPFDDCDAIVCYGGAKATDNHLASFIALTTRFIEWLKRPEQRRRDRHTTKQLLEIG